MKHFKKTFFFFLFLNANCASLFAATSTLNEGIEAFKLGDFPLAQSIFSKHVDEIEAKIYSFAIQNNFDIKPSETIIKEIMKNNEIPIYKILEGRLHLLNMHPKSEPKIGLRIIEEFYEKEPYATFTLGLFYEGKFGHVKSIRKANEWYEILIRANYQEAKERHRLIQDLIESEPSDDEWEEDFTSTSLFATGAVSRLDPREESPAGGCGGSREVNPLEKTTALTKVNFEDLFTIDKYKDIMSIKVKSGKSYGSKEIQKIFENLSVLRKLEILDLSLCNIKSAELINLIKLGTLTYLNLNYTHIDNIGATHLSKLLSLRTLYLVNCGIDTEGAMHISKLLNLSKLNLNSNPIGNNGAKYLSGLTNLTALELMQTGIDSIGTEYISKLSKLSSLNLGFNNIGNEGVQFISALTSLEQLKLQKSNIRYEGIKYLVKLERLIDLDLRENIIGPYLRFIPAKGIEAYCELSKSLSKLYLFGNNLGPVSQELIKEALPFTSINF